MKSKNSVIALHPLEARLALSAAPVIDGAIAVSAAIPEVNRPITLTVDAQDDVGVIGVTFYLDRNGNGGWDPGVDQSLGNIFSRDSRGKFSLTVTPDASWNNYANLIADAVDADGQWASARAGTQLSLTARPLVLELNAHLSPNVGIPEVYVVDLTAKTLEPLGTQFADGVTFFIDLNGNGGWDAGIDTDLGYSTRFDSSGNYTLPVTTGLLPAGTSFAAAAHSADPRFARGDGFGAVRTSPLSLYSDPPQITSVSYVNLDRVWDERPGQFATTGDRLEFTVTAQAPMDLAAITMFYDANHNGRWDAGTDTHLAQQFFAPDILGARTRFTITLTPAMGSDLQSFVFAANDRSALSGRGDFSWSATQTAWVRIIAPPAIDSVSAVPPDVQGEPVYALVNARDDRAIAGFMAFIDVNGNGSIDSNESYVNNSTLLTGNTRSGRWSLALPTRGIAHGTYQLGVAAYDYEGGQTALTFVSVTI